MSVKSESIFVVLGVSNKEYCLLVYDFFADWCLHLEKTKGIDADALYSNMNVYSWYQKNFEFLVTIPFLQDTKQYQEAGINDTRLYFDVFLIYQKNMFDFFPGVLLGLIKNQKTKRHGV